MDQFRRLRIRYDRSADIHEAFLAWLCMDLLAAARKAMIDSVTPNEVLPGPAR